MKKLAVLAGCFAVAVSANAVLIYDSIGTTTTYTTTGGLPRNRMADSMTLLDPGAGAAWEITSIDVIVWATANTFANVSAEVILWNQWNSAGWGGAGTNVFQSEAGRETFNLGAVPTSTLHTVTFTNPITMSAFADVGIEIQLLGDGVKSDSVAIGLRDAVADVGSSTNLFYRDADNDEIIETTDGRTITNWTNANAMIRINGNVVPEPGTFIAIGIGLAGLALARRRK